MTSNIEKIYHDFRADFENKPDYVIDFYSKNSLLLINILTFKNKEELGLFIEITWQYLNAVYQKDRFNETIDFADKNLKLVDSELIRLNAIELKNKWYHGILHFKGMAAYRLREYKTSTQIYKYLTTVDTKNDNFKNWLNYSLYGQRIWMVKAINILCGIMIVIDIFFKENIKSFEIRNSLLGIGFLGLLANLGYEYYIKRSYRRTTKQ